MNEKISRKIKKLNILLAIMVVFLHGRNITQFQCNGTMSTVVNWIEKIFSDYVYSIAVPMFFIMSGYLMYLNFDHSTIHIKLKHRVKSLVIPYFIWNTIALVYFQFFTFIPGIKERMNTVLPIRSFSGYIKGILFFSNNQVNWFLFQLIVYMIAAPVLYRILKKRKICLLFLMILLILNFASVEGNWVSVTRFDTVLRLDCLFYYSVGAVAALHFQEKILWRSGEVYTKKQMCIIGAGCIIGTMLLGISYYSKYNLFILGVILLIRGLSAGMDFFAISLERLESLNSFFVLQVHYLIMYPVKKIVSIIWHQSSVVMCVSYFLIPLVTILVISKLTIYMQRYCSKVYNVLVGGRS